MTTAFKRPSVYTGAGIKFAKISKKKKKKKIFPPSKWFGLGLTDLLTFSRNGPVRGNTICTLSKRSLHSIMIGKITN